MLLDSQQLLVEKKLKQLAQNLESKNSESFFKKIISTKTVLKSFYIYGDVGRGKSMLMKNFYNSLLKTSKIYFHFKWIKNNKFKCFILKYRQIFLKLFEYI